MLRIGYVRLRGEPAQEIETTAKLRAAGCQVVRTDEAGDEGRALSSILEFVGSGDRLVVPRLLHLGDSASQVLELLDKLHARGASAEVLEPDLSSQGPTGAVLRAVLEAVMELAPEPRRSTRRNRSPEILALHRAGLGTVEIARRLGVSRMTVWRTVKGAMPRAGSSQPGKGPG